MRKATQFLYIYFLKPILFLFPADSVHTFFLRTGHTLGKYSFFKKIFKSLWAYEDKILEQNVCNLNFKNPIGLSAGFDYDGDLVEILPSIGFGFNTVGTVTYQPYSGNPAPMLSRLPKSRALLVNKGFKNSGVKNVLSSFKDDKSTAPRGVSIGSTNKPYANFQEMLQDIESGFREAENFNNFDYYELNISCPNLLNLQNLKEQLASPTGLQKVLDILTGLNLQRPVFIKMPLERSESEIKEMLDVANGFPFISGLIFSNLAKDRTNTAFDINEIQNAGRGNFSGKPVCEKSNALLRYVYKTHGKRFVLIGVGGVFTAEDAYEKIRLGASLIQMITGMVFMGPQQIGIINKELAELLKRDGYKNIQEAIGTKA